MSIDSGPNAVRPPRISAKRTFLRKLESPVGPPSAGPASVRPPSVALSPVVVVIVLPALGPQWLPATPPQQCCPLSYCRTLRVHLCDTDHFPPVGRVRDGCTREPSDSRKWDNAARGALDRRDRAVGPAGGRLPRPVHGRPSSGPARRSWPGDRRRRGRR